MQTTSTLLLTFLLASASCVVPHGGHGGTHHERVAVCAGCGDDEHAPLARRGPPPFERGPGRDGVGPDGHFGRGAGPAGRPPHGPPPFARGERGARGGERGRADHGRPEFAPHAGFGPGGEGPRGRPPFERGRGPGFGTGPELRGGPGRGPGPRPQLRPPSPDDLAAVLGELELTPEQRARADAQLAELRAHPRPQPGHGNVRPGPAGPDGAGPAGPGRPDARPNQTGRRAPGAGPRRGPQVWREILGDETFERFRERMRARHGGQGPSPAGDAGPRPPHANPPSAPPAGAPAPAAPPRETRSA